MKTNSNTQVASLLSTPEATDGLRINRNYKCWDKLYLELRKLCVLKGTRIKKYAPEYTGSSPIRFRKGEVIIKQDFWDSLKPAHKSQLSAIINKIRSIQQELMSA